MENKSKGILFMLLAAFFFALMAAAVKLTGDIPAVEKVFFRNFLGVFVASYMIFRKKQSFRGNNIKMLVQRSILGVLGMIAYFYSISRLMLADAVIINKLSPFFTLVFAGIFLKERVSKIQIIAILLALAGTGLVTRPRFDISVLPAFIGILGALLGAGAYTTIRHLRHTDSPITIVFYFTVISSISLLPFMLAGQFVFPTLQQFVGLLSIGVFGTAAQLLLTHAYHYAPAGEVSIYFYADIIFSILIGLIALGDRPDVITLLGGVFVLGGGFLNYLQSAKVEEKVDGGQGKQ